MSGREHIELLVRVARAYWIDGDSQDRIAGDIGYSRSMVSRLLGEARDHGIVSITVSHPLERALELEERLVEMYGLTRAYVSEEPIQSADDKTLILAVEALRESLGPDSVLALTNGRAVAATVNAFPSTHMARTTVVQAMGTVARGSNIADAPEIVQTMSKRLGASHQLLPAPLVVGSSRLATALRREGSISMTLAMAAHADVLLTGIGQSDRRHEGAIFHGLMTVKEHDSLIRAGAVGHICGHHIDAEGHHVDNEFCERLIAVSFSRLFDIRNVIAVAWGANKIPAIRAALASGTINRFVTDTDTAQRLLERVD